MVAPPRVPTGCEELSAFTDEFAKVPLRDGRGEKAHRHSHWYSQCAAYCKTIMAMPLMQEWIAGAKAEPELEELDVEF